MTAIKRKELESVIINKFLTVLRNNLTDPLSPARANSNWVRSSVMVRAATANPQGRKRYILKQSQKPGYPQVIVSDFNDNNSKVTINKSGGRQIKVEGELTIRILDIGDVTRIGSLAGQISNTLSTRTSEFTSVGLGNLEWESISLPGYADDDNEYNEKQISLTFIARLTEWT